MASPGVPSVADPGMAGARVLFRPKYIWTAIAVVALLQLGVAAVRRTFVAAEVRPLRHQLAELPMTLGPWKGKDVTLEKRIVDAVGADQLVDRMYTHSDGTKLTASCAVWLSPSEWVPHRPPLCYAANGWKPVENRILPLPKHPDVEIAVDTYEQSGARVVVAYWYQLEKMAYRERNGARSVRSALWGKRQWSPLVKTLIQTDEADGTESKVLDIASQIYEFNCEL